MCVGLCVDLLSTFLFRKGNRILVVREDTDQDLRRPIENVSIFPSKIKLCLFTRKLYVIIPLPEGCGRTNPGSRKGAPVVRPAGFSSVTPYVHRQVTRFTRSFNASFDSSSLACSSLDTKRDVLLMLINDTRKTSKKKKLSCT